VVTSYSHSMKLVWIILILAVTPGCMVFMENQTSSPQQPNSEHDYYLSVQVWRDSFVYASSINVTAEVNGRSFPMHETGICVPADRSCWEGTLTDQQGVCRNQIQGEFKATYQYLALFYLVDGEKTEPFAINVNAQPQLLLSPNPLQPLGGPYDIPPFTTLLTAVNWYDTPVTINAIDISQDTTNPIISFLNPPTTPMVLSCGDDLKLKISCLRLNAPTQINFRTSLTPSVKSVPVTCQANAP